MTRSTQGGRSSAQVQGLRYLGDEVKGIRRQRRGKGKGFRYVAPGGKTVSGERREWIESLAIPPAWTDVWISPFRNAHVLAYGYDDEGRKQYIYHPEWRKARDADKFDRVVRFARRLPVLRSHLRADLRASGPGRERVVAAVIRTLDLTFSRVGSESYARDHGSYGIATLGREHLAKASRASVRLRFQAKGGKERELDVHDARVAKVVRDGHALPGHRLFEYEDDEGDVHHVTAGDVNGYLRRVMGDGFTSKDFRTWGATVLLLTFLQDHKGVTGRREREQILRDGTQEVAKRLGNTPDVCKKSYLHPAVGAAFLDGSLFERCAGPKVDGLWPEEALTLHLLESYGR